MQVDMGWSKASDPPAWRGGAGSGLLVGAFFAATAFGQLLGAVLIATRPSPRTTAVVILGNLALLGAGLLAVPLA